MELYFLDVLKKAKNLLAFSGGVDSVAMFFSLQKAGIEFDIAIVNYGTRDTCDEESDYAQSLCQTYNKKCFIFKAPAIRSNFESQARRIRYDFFEDVIAKNGYDNLILAHHLNDKLEWFLMQLTKGSGLNTILGFQAIEQREGYQIIRPFINTTKMEIYKYCSNYKFYEDSTNTDNGYKRNKFRHFYANDLIEKYAKGITKSFEYLEEEKKLLYEDSEVFYLGKIAYFQKSFLHQNLYQIDKIMKKMGYVLSASQRGEISKRNFSCEIAGRYIIDNNKNYIFVSKIYTHDLILPKKFKDIARKNAIPKRIRMEIYSHMQSENIPFNDMNYYLEGKFIQSSRHCQ
ncbi:tRNA lysidine(34) synthetase TilS [Helicobacter cappadocius]|uniref:tRNA(Ile)-lysidine synthase n=1 Tax=Helicobacter cappadocius TaxID=3063998 RepID=A0AA90TE29_9HELI|nr:MULTISPECIES: tRNA lysidine(34) synthetase TilS [unclassified Helicobacter]MDO7252428.1 tRNA lysidine(34) synthetase TilS [Helicobacter sp. faydin-H75]MDP2538295.1 tRNA lysidine(34) synthetase TilS [Helicobacter sp. faydin-H76]